MVPVEEEESDEVEETGGKNRVEAMVRKIEGRTEKKEPRAELKSEKEPSEEFKHLSKQLEKMKEFIRVKGLTEFLDDSDDEDLNLKKVTPVAYKMPKFFLDNDIGHLLTF